LKGDSMTSSTSRMARQTGATQVGASTSIGRSGCCSRRRRSSGCAMTASPIQLGEMTSVRNMIVGVGAGEAAS